MKLIGVTGGIGAGKSVVCGILSAMGYDVYDCDSRAKQLMDTSSLIKGHLRAHISLDVVDNNGNIDRALLASIVFSDPEKLKRLNAIVHAGVYVDIDRWRKTSKSKEIAFVESAILYQSHLDELMDVVWEVVAPEPLRIERVCRRNNLSVDQVKARIEAQKYTPEHEHPAVYKIVNDDCHSLLRQINVLLGFITDPPVSLKQSYGSTKIVPGDFLNT